ncbi:dihydrofolate reductase, partial [Brevibacillus sp. MCWH]|uniref:dihydrofolate reductase n=1 Tax=Brevibacillus sp. MCWH TaxID=2508871 RepID=UPI0014920EB9
IVLGGAEIYSSLLPYVDFLYVTRIFHKFKGDTYFPSINEKEWKLICAQSGVLDEKNKYTHVFLMYKRVSHITVK